jgi:hypothetical protein
MVWISRLIVPVFVLRVARAERKAEQAVEVTPQPEAVAA